MHGIVKDADLNFSTVNELCRTQEVRQMNVARRKKVKIFSAQAQPFLDQIIILRWRLEEFQPNFNSGVSDALSTLLKSLETQDL